VLGPLIPLTLTSTSSATFATNWTATVWRMSSTAETQSAQRFVERRYGGAFQDFRYGLSDCMEALAMPRN
jgi:hypothetical protein